ncbi:uncharacterized protein TrAFT101_007121 [Trichoderma asperellum]|uniref:uncharacterized protein n=1 Tax=Trichoderma asperellum TaxID=101201 RepID=UPI003333257B|nr:hypothetical protein TrAFT101_007121 [Trichoderma asperellum]
MRSPADGTYDVSDSDRSSPLQLSRLGQAAAGAKSITTGALDLVERREKRREEKTAEQRRAICQPVGVRQPYVHPREWLETRGCRFARALVAGTRQDKQRD